MKPIIYLMLLMLPLTSCAQGLTNEKTHDLMIGQRLQLGDYILIFQEVEEDSRCPKGTNCIWAGRAIVKLSIVTPGKETQEHTAIFGQTKGGEKANTTVIQDGSYTVELTKLLPYPQADKEMGPYVLKLVEKN